VSVGLDLQFCNVFVISFPVHVNKISSYCQWHNILTGGPWTNYIKGPIPHFEFTEEFIIIKVLTKITINHKTMLKCEVKSNFIIKAKLSV